MSSGWLFSGAVEEEKHEFCTQESEPLAKPEQTEACGVHKICFVCDSCEEMYHVACIEPAGKEIPPKSWYRASCTANGIGPLHENCVICERLNAPRTLNNNVADENYNANCETFTELDENSNCSVDIGLQLSPVSKNPSVCNICGSDVEKGEKLRSCEHPYCPNKYYHVKCLTMIVPAGTALLVCVELASLIKLTIRLLYVMGVMLHTTFIA